MTPRNAPCPCGSGKKFKRCCINKPKEPQSTTTFNTHTYKRMDNKSRFSFSGKYKPAESLKVLSLLQLQPQNHGKNIRIEYAVSEIVNSITASTKTDDLGQLTTDLSKELKKDYNEDPPANFFTENIVFSTGNNVVYPGIFIDNVEILQLHINSLIPQAGYSETFLQECHAALLLLLHIQNLIAQKLGHTHRMFEEIESDDLFIPPHEYIKENKELFEFTFDDIGNICAKYRIPYNTIDSFVYKWQDSQINPDAIDENPLFRRPFVFIDNKFILTIPTAIMQCLIDFILEKADQHGMKSIHEGQFSKATEVELEPIFWRMGWRHFTFDFPSLKAMPNYMHVEDVLYEIDRRKYVYTLLLTEKILSQASKSSNQKEFSQFLQKHIEGVVKKLKQTADADEVLLLVIVSKIGLVSYSSLAFTRLEGITYFLSLTPVELMVLTRQWKFDNLTLWKYVKYLTLAEKTIAFAPLTSQLAMFNFYKENSESFYHSDEQRYSHILLDFHIEGDIRRKGISKLDKIGVGYGSRKVSGYMQCIRKEDHYPVYMSQEIYLGVSRSCLLKYSFPIWVEGKNNDIRTEPYVNAILYWLHEIFDDAKSYLSQLRTIPVRIEVELHTDYHNLEKLEDLSVYDDTDLDIPYRVDMFNRQIFFTIPIEMIQYFSSSDNKGERILIQFMLETLEKLIIEIGGTCWDESAKRHLLDKYIPLGPKKMILLFSGDRDIRIGQIDVQKKRYIQDSDVSFILDNQLQWSKIDIQAANLNSTESKTKLLNTLVGMHYKKVMEHLAQVNKRSILVALCRRNEALLQSRSFRKVSYPARELCYSKYYNVYEEFSESEADIIETNLAGRVLIEFVLVSSSEGSIQMSEDEIDLLLAHTIELINYASLSDSIKYELEDPDMSILPSGRLGISKNDTREGMMAFRDIVYAEEMHSYAEEFHTYFKKRKGKIDANNEQERYAAKIIKAFNDEWGITLGEIDTLCYGICASLFAEGLSVKTIPENEFIEWLINLSGFDRAKILAFANRLTFQERPSPLQAPPGFEPWEVYPWRFNRRISYMHRPLIKVDGQQGSEYILSARHILTASENLMSLFYNGTLKVDKGDKTILQLLAERNKIKGNQYRNEVLRWLKENTELEVVDFEVKIKPKGFFVSEIDKGDIDILAIDRQKNLVYSIECKNTVQSKITYDYKMEIDNYLGINGKDGLITKHVKRDAWLKENIHQVQQKLLFPEPPQITSLVISKHILPLKHIKVPSLPIVSFYELKSGRFAF